MKLLPRLQSVLYTAALNAAQIRPVYGETGTSVITYDKYIGTKWMGSNRSLLAAKASMDCILKEYEHATGKHTPPSVSSGAASEEHNESAE